MLFAGESGILSQTVPSPKLLPRLDAAESCVPIGPLTADVQPNAAVHDIGQVCRTSVAIVPGWDVDAVVIVFDRERRNDCPGA